MSRTATRRPEAKPKPKAKSSPWRWVAFLAPLLFLAGLAVASAVGGSSERQGGRATEFSLPATDGSRVSLAETLEKGDALLFFSMGPGCDICFLQIPELEAGLAERGLTLLPIMVEDPLVKTEAARLGIERPILLDAGARISQAYDMVGLYGHGDLPTHSFALVRSDGTVAWVRDYPDVFVPAVDFFAELDTVLGA